MTQKEHQDLTNEAAQCSQFGAKLADLSRNVDDEEAQLILRKTAKRFHNLRTDLLECIRLLNPDHATARADVSED